jgi:uncharacterized protein (TIGR02453 family)
MKKDTLNFLLTLKENNNREWFAENKTWYERSRLDVEESVTQLIRRFTEFDLGMKYLDPKKCVFRIYRDTRFSPDKTPYKTHFGVVFNPKGAKNSGYYLHIDPAESFLCCGLFMLRPDQLKSVRQGIYQDFDTFSTIISNKKFKKEFGDLVRDDDTLRRVPNDFDKYHPAAEYLKLKYFYIKRNITEKELLSERFVGHAAEIYELMQPLNDFLQNLIEE